jgi:hypothetical protein
MLVKTSIGFLKKDPDAKFSISVKTIVDALTDNPNYQSPPPTPALPIVLAAWDTFNTKLAAADKGGVLATAEKNDARAELAGLVLQLSRYVDGACNGDLTVLLSSGFPIQKPQRFPIGDLPAPTIIVFTQGIHSGTLAASVAPVTGGATYNWQLATAAAPNTVLQTAQTTAASTEFGGLTPGVVYRVVANVVGAAGPSDWSEPATAMSL